MLTLNSKQSRCPKDRGFWRSGVQEWLRPCWLWPLLTYRGQRTCDSALSALGRYPTVDDTGSLLFSLFYVADIQGPLLPFIEPPHLPPLERGEDVHRLCLVLQVFFHLTSFPRKAPADTQCTPRVLSSSRSHPCSQSPCNTQTHHNDIHCFGHTVRISVHVLVS